MDQYSAIVGVLVLLFGVSVGSFINVLIYRWGSGTLWARSKCLSCSRALTPLMLIPLLSFVVQRGRCRHCSARISSQYAWVEFCSGILFVLIASKWGLLHTHVLFSDVLRAVFDMAIWSLLIFVFVYDLKHKIIPDQFSLLFALAGAVLLFLDWTLGNELLWRALAGPLLALPFAAFWLVSRGRWMGLGDAKLSWGIGWFLGLTQGITAIMSAFWIAFFPALFLLLLQTKRYTMKGEIPFAPFLILGTLVVYLFGFDITAWIFPTS